MLLKIEDLRRSKPAEDNPLPSAHKLGAPVMYEIGGRKVFSRVLGVTFMAGKVLYALMVYTGNTEKDLADQYGVLNNLGWDVDGREYQRVLNVDSTFVHEYSNCKCMKIMEDSCQNTQCPRRVNKQGSSL